MTTDAPTIAERYASAVSTSDLRVRTGGRKAADVVAASGFAKGRGAIFARCRAEFDLAHAEYRGKVSATDARMLACMRMPSLKAGKAEALMLATSREWGLEPASIVKLSWQALSEWLDPNCGRCDGRGFNGGYDGPQVLCTYCKGAGKRRDGFAREEMQRALVDWLIARIEGAASEHSGGTARALRA